MRRKSKPRRLYLWAHEDGGMGIGIISPARVKQTDGTTLYAGRLLRDDIPGIVSDMLRLAGYGRTYEPKK